MRAGSGEAWRLSVDCGTERWRNIAANAALLSVDWMPARASASAEADGHDEVGAAESAHAQDGLITASSMDGSVSVLSGSGGSVLASLQLGARLVTKVQWCRPQWQRQAGAAAGSSAEAEMGKPAAELAGKTGGSDPNGHYLLAATGAATLMLLRYYLEPDASSGTLAIVQSVPFAQNVADFVLVSRRSEEGRNHAASSPDAAVDASAAPSRSRDGAAREQSHRQTPAHEAVLVAVKGSNCLRRYPILAIEQTPDQAPTDTMGSLLHDPKAAAAFRVDLEVPQVIYARSPCS